MAQFYTHITPIVSYGELPRRIFDEVCTGYEYKDFIPVPPSGIPEGKPQFVGYLITVKDNREWQSTTFSLPRNT